MRGTRRATSRHGSPFNVRHKAMTIFELEASIDCGFHDALLHAYSVDLVARMARFRLEICVGNPAASDYASREARRFGTLILSGLEYLAFDLPDFNYDGRTPYLIDLCGPSIASGSASKDGLFSGRFFVSSTNSFVHFSAMAAEFVYETNA